MDGWFIVFIIMGAIALIGTLIAVATRNAEPEYESDIAPGTVFKGIAALLWALTLVFLFVSSVEVVGAKQIGVPVTFGKPSGHLLHNGWNWKNPATAVHMFDGSLQTERYSSDKNDQGDPVQVRLFSGSIASVNVTFQWRLADDDSVKQVYLNYKDPENINVNLVKRALQQSLNIAFEAYNPYAALIAAQSNGGVNTPGAQQVAMSYADLQGKALSQLKSELGGQGVQAVSLTIASINYDANTQHELDSLGTAIAQTQVAIQGEKTAEAQAAANKTLNDSKATDTTLQQLCIQATQKVLEDGKALPAGWNCFGPSNAQVTTK